MTASSPQPRWKLVKLGEVVRNCTESVTNRAEQGIERVVGLDNIDSNSLHIRRWGAPDSSPSFRTRFRPGQTLFGKRRAYLRKVARASFEGVCTQNILVFETRDPRVLLPELLPFLCRTERFVEHAVSTSKGSLFPNADWNAIREFVLPLPPIDEQKRIAELLWAADEVVERHLKLRESLSQSWQTEMSAFWKASEASNISIMTIEDVAAPCRNAIADGPFGSNLKTIHYRDSGIPVIQSGFVTSGQFSAAKYVYIEREHFESQIRSRVVPGDIIMAKIGENCGTCAILPDGHPESIVAGNALKITVNEKVCRTKYLLAVFHYLYKVDRMRLLKKVTAQPAIGLSALKRMQIPVPSLEAQDLLLHRVSSISDGLTCLDGHILHVRQLMKVLLETGVCQGAGHV